MRAPFCHIVIPAPELEPACSFYETVFGWTVYRRSPGARYWAFESGNVDGALDASRTPARDSVILMLQVEDIDATLSAIREAGGTVTKERSAIGESARGFDAYFLDPNGNELGIFSDR